MSTYQPPGGQPPEGTPGYAPPQDPWAGGYDPGLASVPTDPIPQQYDPYAAYQQGDVWSQQTVAQGGHHGYLEPPQRSRAWMFVLVFFAVLLLGGGGGFAAWYLITQRNAGPGVDPTVSPTQSASGTGVAFDPYAVNEGDCLVNNGTLTDPEIVISPCSTAGSFKVVRIVSGVDIVENEQGAFDDDVTSVAACKDTNYQTWYGYQDPVDDARDLFFCMTNN